MLEHVLEQQREQGVHVFPDGDQWCALRGADLQEGQAHFGPTPEEAFFGWVKEHGHLLPDLEGK